MDVTVNYETFLEYIITSAVRIHIIRPFRHERIDRLGVRTKMG